MHSRSTLTHSRSTCAPQVLEQETAFDGLQWFQSVGAHYEAEAAGVAARSPSKRAPTQVTCPIPHAVHFLLQADRLRSTCRSPNEVTACSVASAGLCLCARLTAGTARRPLFKLTLDHCAADSVRCRQIRQSFV